MVVIPWDDRVHEAAPRRGDWFHRKKHYGSADGAQWFRRRVLEALDTIHMIVLLKKCILNIMVVLCAETKFSGVKTFLIV